MPNHTRKAKIKPTSKKDLAAAICMGMKATGQSVDEEAAQDMAEHILNFFDSLDRIIDNTLEPEDRDTFYIGEDIGVLSTEREETNLYDGREWRIYYWLQEKAEIKKMARRYRREKAKKPKEGEFKYEHLPEEIWSYGRKMVLEKPIKSLPG